MRLVLAVAVGICLSAGDIQASNESDLGRLMETGSCSKCDLRGADLSELDLSWADLSWADLTNSKLDRANLSNAILGGAVLSGAEFWSADLTNAMYQPRTNPNIDSMWDVTGLSTLRWHGHPTALTRLRKAFRDAGMRPQERQVTYAIRRWERLESKRQCSNGEIGECFEMTFNFFLFEITSEYGMSPGRPLVILVVLIGVFSIIYVAPVVGHTNGGIYRVWSQEAIEVMCVKRPERIKAKGVLGFGYALYFSLLSAAHVGWRDLNVGNWIVRIQPHEYVLQATGWVRVISGIQSLISVYLIALAVLTYFGRPFE